MQGVIAGLLLFLPSCGHIVTKEKSYAKGSGVDVNGALVRSAVKPMGGEPGFSFSAMVYMAGSAKLDGPFLWRVEASGKDGHHKSLTVHRIKVVTKASLRSEWYPEKLLGKSEEFYPVKGEPGEAFAQYQIPGKLEVYPDEDGAITILVDLTVRSVEKSVRKLIRFEMDPEQSKDVDFLFLPADIVSSLDGSDPKEWKW